MHASRYNTKTYCGVAPALSNSPRGECHGPLNFVGLCSVLHPYTAPGFMDVVDSISDIWSINWVLLRWIIDRKWLETPTGNTLPRSANLARESCQRLRLGMGR